VRTTSNSVLTNLCHLQVDPIILPLGWQLALHLLLFAWLPLSVGIEVGVGAPQQRNTTSDPALLRTHACPVGSHHARVVRKTYVHVCAVNTSTDAHRKSRAFANKIVLESSGCFEIIVPRWRCPDSHAGTTSYWTCSLVFLYTLGHAADRMHQSWVTVMTWLQRCWQVDTVSVLLEGICVCSIRGLRMPPNGCISAASQLQMP
jgi:hypothetical protein